MSFAFFVSSIGDADLAKATIRKILHEKSTEQIYLIPLSKSAQDRTSDMASLTAITLFKDLDFSETTIVDEKLFDQINEFISLKAISKAFVGVPSSSNEEKALQIAHNLKIPYVLAYEFMFRPEEHALWRHLPKLANIPYNEFLVPLPSAISDIATHVTPERIHVTGHLSIDAALAKITASVEEKNVVKRELMINPDQEFIFASASTQPLDVDCIFIRTLLSELASGDHPHIQIRLGLHPGIQDLDLYLKTILAVCADYPALSSQFKIVLTKKFIDKLKDDVLKHELSKAHPFLLPVEMDGPTLSKHADKICQSVPGALLNEAALHGTPAYFQQKTRAYLPDLCFSESCVSFFAAKPRPTPYTAEELGLDKSSTSERVARVF